MPASLPFVSSLGNVSGEFYATLLRTAYLQVRRIYPPDIALARDPDLYEKILREPVIAHALMLRSHMVAGREWVLEPWSESEEDQKLARVMEEMLRQLPMFAEARYELAQAIFRGRAYSYIQGRRRPGSTYGEITADWWVPTALRDVDSRRVRLVPEWENRTPKGTPSSNGRAQSSRRLKLRWELFSVEAGEWRLLRDRRRWIMHAYQDEEARLGYGRGLIESLYFYWLMKAELLRRLAEASARFAKGVVTVGLDSLRASSEERSNDEMVRKVVEVVDAMLTRGTLVHGHEDKVEFHEPTGSGARLILDAIQYIDQAIVRLCFGSILPAGLAEGTGSLARAEVEYEVTEAIIAYDRVLLDETITRDLVGWLLHINRRQLAAAGLDSARRPRFRTIPRRQQNPQAQMQIIAAALAAGIPLRKDEVYRALGFTPPEEGDEIIEPAPPRAAVPQIPGL